jgi:hypothetical protein
MRSKAYILQNFCIIDSMKLYNQGLTFLYNTFYQGGTILPGGGGGGPPGPSPGYASAYVMSFIFKWFNAFFGSVKYVHNSIPQTLCLSFELFEGQAKQVSDRVVVFT